MIYSLAGIIALPIVGYLVDVIGARYTIMLSSAFIIPGIISYMMMKEKKEIKEGLKLVARERK